MIKTQYAKVAALVAVLLLAGISLIAADMPTAGATAPDFTLPSQEGEQVSLSDFRGQWVVLYFYPKDFTQGCTIEAHNFQVDQEQYTALNAAIVGVSADTVDSHADFCTEENLTFKVLADPELDAIEKYGSVVKLEGAMRERFGQDAMAARNTFLVNPEGKVAKVYTQVNPNPHSKEVLADLASLQK